MHFGRKCRKVNVTPVSSVYITRYNFYVTFIYEVVGQYWKTIRDLLRVSTIFYTIRMSHWHQQMVNGAKFWISCKWLKAQRKGSQWQLIKCSAPSTICWRQWEITDFTFKVQLFWKSQKNMCDRRHGFDIY